MAFKLHAPIITMQYISMELWSTHWAFRVQFMFYCRAEVCGFVVVLCVKTIKHCEQSKKKKAKNKTKPKNNNNKKTPGDNSTH